MATSSNTEEDIKSPRVRKMRGNTFSNVPFPDHSGAIPDRLKTLGKDRLVEGNGMEFRSQPILSVDGVMLKTKPVLETPG